MIKSDLPFGSEFSPSQIDLKTVLEIADEKGGNWKAFEDEIRLKYFDQNKTTKYNRRKLANNTKLSMIAYGIIDRDAELTEFGQKLFNIRNNSEKLYSKLAKHIIVNLHGMNLIQCVKDIQAAGEDVNLIKLRQWLEERSIHFPRGGKHPSIMRLWLEKAGIFTGKWLIDDSAIERIILIKPEDFDILLSFTDEQKAYIKTLANIAERGPFASNEIEKLASATYGIKYNEKNLPKSVLYPLQEAGYITLQRGTKTTGRGAKPFLVSGTAKLLKEIIIPLIKQTEKQTTADLRPLLRKPIAEIRKEIKSKSKHIKGLALEALAFKLMRLIDLEYIATRLRGTATGGAEVDLIFESTRLVFSRWQVQCKNTKSVSLDDIAKEVGLTHLLKSNVIVMISTGQIGPEARKYANKIMTDSNLCIITMESKDIEAIEQNPSKIVDIFNREARKAMEIKKIII